MTEQTGGAAPAQKGPATRIDWRTGKPMVKHDDEFWSEHERRRIEQGLGVPQYCAAHGLALSTYRHRVNGKPRRASTSPPATAPTSARSPTPALQRSTPSFVAVPAPAGSADTLLELTVQDMTIRLSGGAAERVLARVLERLT